jgi:hypothetical protein
MPTTNLPEQLVAVEEATLRDYFAAAAMQGFCANPECERTMLDTLAEMAYAAADEMLKQREGRPMTP